MGTRIKEKWNAKKEGWVDRAEDKCQTLAAVDLDLKLSFKKLYLILRAECSTVWVGTPSGRVWDIRRHQQRSWTVGCLMFSATCSQIIRLVFGGLPV